MLATVPRYTSKHGSNVDPYPDPALHLKIRIQIQKTDTGAFLGFFYLLIQNRRDFYCFILTMDPDPGPGSIKNNTE